MSYVEVRQDETLGIFKSIYLCVGCNTELGSTKKLYCEFCGTKAGREKLAKENVEVAERISSLKQNKQWVFNENKPAPKTQ